MTLFLNPLESSYLRLGQMKAPGYVSWSAENRSQLVRVPAASGEFRRAELRSPDPAANPYIAFTLMIRAGLYGIGNALALPAPLDVNLYRADEKTLSLLERLPKSISEAKTASRDVFIEESIPLKIADIYRE